MGTGLRQGLDSNNLGNNLSMCQHPWLHFCRPSGRYVRQESSLLLVHLHHDGLQSSQLLLRQLGHVCHSSIVCRHRDHIFPHDPVQLFIRIHAVTMEVMVYWLSLLANTRLYHGSSSLVAERLAKFSFG